MITTSDLSNIDNNQIAARIEFYKAHYAFVELVQCMKCKSDLCLELTGLIGPGLGLEPNDQGVVVLPVSEKLLSSRTRLDETGTGEPMHGYQCACGNDNRVSEAEKDAGVPVGARPMKLDPFSKQSIRERLRTQGKKGNFKMRGNTKYFDKFRAVRV